MKKVVIILIALIVITISITFYAERNENKNEDEIYAYLESIYGIYEYNIPEFENIDEAEYNWFWGNILLNYEENGGVKAFTEEELINASKTMYGNNNMKLLKESSDIIVYDNEANSYWLVGMSTEMNPSFVINDIKKNDNEYIVDIVEYIEHVVEGKEGYDSNKAMLSTIDYKEVETLEAEENVIDEESYNVFEKQIHKFVKDNQEKFSHKEIVISIDEITNKLYIKSAKNIK